MDVLVIARIKLKLKLNLLYIKKLSKILNFTKINKLNLFNTGICIFSKK